MSESNKNAERTTTAVREGYAAIARAGLSSAQAGIQSIATAFGYSDDELASVPAEANMGLSCGNPVAMASIREGETVVDLGCGGGLDVFLAAKKVGPTGKAIGIDMTAEMISLARRNAERGGYQNVKFHLAEIEAIPLPSDSVDCVISNCVLNLCTDKDAALKEIHRILKPGGRVAISDIALKQTLPPAIANEIAAWTGCIAGAITLDENRAALEGAGFSAVDIKDAGSDLNAYRSGGHAVCCGPESAANQSTTCEPMAATAATMSSTGGSSCCTPPPAAPRTERSVEQPAFHDTMGKLLDTFDVNAYAASIKIFALKSE